MKKIIGLEDLLGLYISELPGIYDSFNALCVFTHVCMHVHVRVHVCTCVCACVHLCVCMCTYVCMCVAYVCTSEQAHKVLARMTSHEALSIAMITVQILDI